MACAFAGFAAPAYSTSYSTAHVAPAAYAAPAYYKAPIGYAAPAYGKAAHAEDYFVSRSVQKAHSWMFSDINCQQMFSFNGTITIRFQFSFRKFLKVLFGRNLNEY